MWSESSAWWNWRAERPIRSSGLYPTNSVTLETGRWQRKSRGKLNYTRKKKQSWNTVSFSVATIFLELHIKWEVDFQKGTESWSGWVLPALAVCEAQVHAVTGEEGAGVQRELHAGWVGDGLTQQSHHPGSRRWSAVTPKRTYASRTVENLKQSIGLV